MIQIVFINTIGIRSIIKVEQVNLYVMDVKKKKQHLKLV